MAIIDVIIETSICLPPRVAVRYPFPFRFGRPVHATLAAGLAKFHENAASMLSARTLLRSRNARWLRSLHSQRAVGFVGAGNMGRGMAASLARAGHPVAQFDRDTAALAASAAASPLIEAVGSLEELCSRASTVVVSVAGEAAERSVFLEPGGLLEVAAPGSLLIDAGTVSRARMCASTCTACALVHCVCACR